MEQYLELFLYLVPGCFVGYFVLARVLSLRVANALRLINNPDEASQLRGLRKLRYTNFGFVPAATAKTVLPRLKDLLGASNKDIVEWTLIFFGRHAGSLPKNDCLPDVIKLIGDERIEIRQKALSIVRMFWSVDKSALPELLRLIESSNTEVRQNAAFGLVKIGEEASFAVSELTRVLEKENDRNVIGCLAVLLGRIGGEAQEALPKLRQLAHGGDEELARIADDAIKNISTEEAI